jgi:hypothetical protein
MTTRPTDPEHPDIDLVTVLETSDAMTIAMAEGLLEDAQIPYLAQGDMIQDLFGLGRLTAVNPISGPVTIKVDRPDAEAAARLLAVIGKPSGLDDDIAGADADAAEAEWEEGEPDADDAGGADAPDDPATR